MKRYQSIMLFLILGILLFTCGKTNVSAETVTGKLGDNITWKLEMETGLLTISGKGDMLDCKHKKIPTVWPGDPSCWFDFDDHMWHNTGEQEEAVKKVVIEEGVTSITAHAFHDCINLETIVIPDSVTRIEHCAFYDCYNLREINIPDKVTVIEDYAFDGCGLKKIKLPKNLKKIGYRAFRCCDFKQISIPSSVEIIEANAFEGCLDLEKVTWEGKSRLQEIKTWAFIDCNIKKLVIPASVTKIQDSMAVNGAYEIKVEKGNKKYKSKDGVLFSKDGKTLICYPRKRKAKTYKIPKGVRTIGTSAFYYMFEEDLGYHNLKKITMPDSVRVIKSRAFNNLADVKIERLSKNLKRIEENAFIGCDIMSLKLPDSLVYIGDLCFQNKKGTIVIPKNVKEIHSFSIPPKVKKVVVKSKKIKNLSKKAFFTWNKKVTIVLPKSKKTAYKKLFTKKRLGKKMKFIYQ